MKTHSSYVLTRRSALVSLSTGLFSPFHTKAQAQQAFWEPLPDLPDAKLLDHQGNSMYFLRDLLQKRAFVLNFIFTGCTTICPPQTALLRQARESMSNLPKPLVWLSLSIDPLADTPTTLENYRKKFAISSASMPWYFLTGEPNTVSNLRSVWGDKNSDPNDHLSRLIIGSAASKRYTRMDAFAPPHVIEKRIRELMS
jgi:protein SCO1